MCRVPSCSVVLESIWTISPKLAPKHSFIWGWTFSFKMTNETWLQLDLLCLTWTDLRFSWSLPADSLWICLRAANEASQTRETCCDWQCRPKPKFGTWFDLEFTWLDSRRHSQDLIVQTLIIHFQITGLLPTISTPVWILIHPSAAV